MIMKLKDHLGSNRILLKCVSVVKFPMVLLCGADDWLIGYLNTFACSTEIWGIVYWIVNVNDVET